METDRIVALPLGCAIGYLRPGARWTAAGRSIRRRTNAALRAQPNHPPTTNHPALHHILRSVPGSSSQAPW